ncbi:MAG: hypothetical protein A3I00_07960 [Betaproteobacteria bacterium RIFCSPLOWO2_02_FULL_64_12]|nr:MAG: hypothetical protein A3I00_07960 [Betaproteobacteria bacterium RIFCSPLOWO2_02_FULL_64_12]
MRRPTWRRAAVPVLALALLAGCTLGRAGSYRPSTLDEARRAEAAIWPLLEALGYPLPAAGSSAACKIGLTVTRGAAINAAVHPGTREPCVHFTLALTDGALARLGVEDLRAIFAHELGHIVLGHGGARNALGRTEKEREADQFAVELLKKLEPRYPGACRALVGVLTMLAEQPGRVPWLSTHPSPARRAEAARASCNR